MFGWGELKVEEARRYSRNLTGDSRATSLTCLQTLQRIAMTLTRMHAHHKPLSQGEKQCL